MRRVTSIWQSINMMSLKREILRHMQNGGIIKVITIIVILIIDCGLQRNKVRHVFS